MHLGSYHLLETLGLPTPYKQITDATMTQWTRNAMVPYQLREKRGDALSITDQHMFDNATRLHDLSAKTQSTTEAIKQHIEIKAFKCINDISAHCDLNRFAAQALIREWPGTSINYDMLSRDSLLMVGPIPSMYPIGTQRAVSSTFGMVNVKAGSHATISEETERYPNFARLLSLWAAGFSEECFGSIVAFTSVEIKKTQEANFAALEGKAR